MASVHLGCEHRLGERGSTSVGDLLACVGLGVVVVNQCVSRKVAAKVGPGGSGMRARVGVGGRVSVILVCWW